MSYHGWVSVLLNSFVALAIAFILPRMSSHEDPTGRGRMSWWVYFAGLVLISLASRELFFASDSPEQTIHAIWLAAAAMAGTILKWALTVLASRGRSFHEKSLVRSLLFSTVGLVWGGRMFLDSGIPVLALFGFANGFFWQAVFDDGGRIFSRERCQ